MSAVNILEKAAVHLKDRAATYDKEDGERSIGATVQAFNAITGDGLMNSEERGWLFMLLLKAVRTQQGSYRADNYEDGAAYFALMGEAASAERGNAVKEWPDEERIDVIAQNGNGGEHYPKIGYYLPDQGGHLVGFINGNGIIMSKDEDVGLTYYEASEFVGNFNAVADASAGEFSDWQVPTKDELNLAWANRDKLAVLRMAKRSYWSATEFSDSDAWIQSFADGCQIAIKKHRSSTVRPVRSVPIDQLVSGAKG